jgi:pyruvate/2-oxoglutarate dehydrogenase complex dihydrolipoamide acyltransferase (E2) component
VRRKGDTVEVGTVIAVLTSDVGASTPAPSGDGAPAKKGPSVPSAGNGCRGSLEARSAVPAPSSGDRYNHSQRLRRAFLLAARSVDRRDRRSVDAGAGVHSGLGSRGRVSKKDVLATSRTRQAACRKRAPAVPIRASTAPSRLRRRVNGRRIRRSRRDHRDGSDAADHRRSHGPLEVDIGTRDLVRRVRCHEPRPLPREAQGLVPCSERASS